MVSSVAANGAPRAALLATITAAALLATVGIYELLLAFSAVLIAAMGVCVNAAAIYDDAASPTWNGPTACPCSPCPRSSPWRST